jgi:hypothetical protein
MSEGTRIGSLSDQLKKLELLERQIDAGEDVREAVLFLIRAQIEAAKPYTSY